jgi:hypothetical protein
MLNAKELPVSKSRRLTSWRVLSHVIDEASRRTLLRMRELYFS